MVNRNSPSKFKSNEVDAPMPVSSEGLRTTDEAGIGQRIRRIADDDDIVTKYYFLENLSTEYSHIGLNYL